MFQRFFLSILSVCNINVKSFKTHFSEKFQIQVFLGLKISIPKSFRAQLYSVKLANFGELRALHPPATCIGSFFRKKFAQNFFKGSTQFLLKCSALHSHALNSPIFQCFELFDPKERILSKIFFGVNSFAAKMFSSSLSRVKLTNF